MDSQEKNIIGINKWHVIWSTVLVVAITIILILLLDSKERNMPTIIGISGSLGTFLGLFLGYLQIKSLREAAEQTRQEISLVLKKVSLIQILSHLSRAIELNKQIKNSIIEPAEIVPSVLNVRMQFLKEELIIIRGRCFENRNSKEYKDFQGKLIDFSSDLNNLQGKIINDNHVELNYTLIHQNVEDILNLLIIMDTKFKQYDSPSI